jgi:very-short-patch-repair endonuclease
VRLVVEVDGGYHEERARLDGARNLALEQLGWHVVRVLEHQVFGDLDAVVAGIADSARRLAMARR